MIYLEFVFLMVLELSTQPSQKVLLKILIAVMIREYIIKFSSPSFLDKILEKMIVQINNYEFDRSGEVET